MSDQIELLSRETRALFELNILGVKFPLQQKIQLFRFVKNFSKLNKLFKRNVRRTFFTFVKSVKSVRDKRQDHKYNQF